MQMVIRDKPLFTLALSAQCPHKGGTPGILPSWLHVPRPLEKGRLSLCCAHTSSGGIHHRLLPPTDSQDLIENTREALSVLDRRCTKVTGKQFSFKNLNQSNGQGTRSNPLACHPKDLQRKLLCFGSGASQCWQPQSAYCARE